MQNFKKIIINLIIILIVLALVLYFSLKDNYDEIMSYISKMNIMWFIIAVVFYLLFRGLIGFTSYQMAKLNKAKISLKKMLQINYIIPFFHGVTPFAGGGQPMEIYFLHNEKISIDKSTNITLQNFIIYQTALVTICIFAVIYNQLFGLFPKDSFMKKLVILGFIINLLILIIGLFVSFSTKLVKYTVKKIIGFLSRLKIVKDKIETVHKFNEIINEYHENALILTKNKKRFIFYVILNVFAIAFNYLITFAVCMGMGLNINFLNAIVMTTYVMMIGNFVPIPGGTGGIEYGFMFFFGYHITGGILTAIMLVWRFISYYLAMIIGGIALVFYRKKEKECE